MRIRKIQCRRDQSATDEKQSAGIPLFNCQNLISAPPRSNALPTIYPRSERPILLSVNLIDLRLDTTRLRRYAQLPGRSQLWSSVHAQRKDQRSKPAPPHCPSCAQTMRLARKTRRFNGLPDLYIFECRKCEMSHTAGRYAAKRNRSPRSKLALGISTSSVTRPAKSKDAISCRESPRR